VRFLPSAGEPLFNLVCFAFYTPIISRFLSGENNERILTLFSGIWQYFFHFGPMLGIMANRYNTLNKLYTASYLVGNNSTILKSPLLL